MRGRMMQAPLLVSSLIEHAGDVYPDQEIVTRTVEGPIHRYTWSDARARARRLGSALVTQGIREGDRIGTLAWNTHRHLEVYYGVSGIGGVCHTLNPRLHPTQLVYIVNHAEDRILFVDLTFVPLIEAVAEQIPNVETVVVLTDSENMPATSLGNAVSYEDFIIDGDIDFDWPHLDEHAAAALCYTSGTTGNPKGALYSNRSTVLHAFGGCMPDVFDLRAASTVLPIVPMFHACAWGIPYAAAATGSKIVFPGPALDGASLFSLMDKEKVKAAWGVPTIWLGLLAEMRKHKRKPKDFSFMLSGGSAVPKSMIQELEKEFAVDVTHGWGMTECSPVGSTTSLGSDSERLPIDEKVELKTYQGRRMYTVDMRIVGENGELLPNDGEAFGELQVRGHAIIDGYHEDEEASSAAMTEDGWLRTGDVARITPEGFMMLVDRTKDLIKSGGEWISSIDLENAAQGHPSIVECGVISAYHPQWDERPLLIAVTEKGVSLSLQDIHEYLKDKVAKWWLPDDVVFVDELPHTATGKISKMTLREQFKDYKLKDVEY